MKLKRIAISIIALVIALSAGIMVSADGGGLVIEVESINAGPGEIIDVAVNITSNPGVSVIKDLRIDLGRGLTLYYPKGENAYTSNASADAWPYVPEKTEDGKNTGMLPVMGRPTAANIGDTHIVLNFLDVLRPFDSTETGTLVTLKVHVDSEASGDIPIRITGGMYGDLSRDGDKEPVLIGGTIKTGGDTDEPAPGSTADDAQPQSGAETQQTAADAQTDLNSAIKAALENKQKTQSNPDNQDAQSNQNSRSSQSSIPVIKLTPEMSTIITSEMLDELREDGNPVRFELEDGTVIEINPADIPTTLESLDLNDLPPGIAKTISPASGMPVWAIILISAAAILITAAAAIYLTIKKQAKTAKH